MQVLGHHLYEYRKGLRYLVLHTLSSSDKQKAIQRLEAAEIEYEIYPLGNDRINIFFGAKECVDVIRAINKPNLKDYTFEEDFILGTMLGYERRLQCKRYLKMRKKRPAPRLCRCSEKGGCSHH